MADGPEDKRQERYADLLGELEGRLNAPDEHEHIRAIARQEADKRIVAWIGIGAFITAIVFWGWRGALAGIGLFVGWSLLEDWLIDRTPGAAKGKVVRQAEDFIRLKITAEAFAAGEPVWRLKEKEYDRDHNQVLAVDSARWDTSWERMFKAAQEFQALSPVQRKKRLRAAAKEAREALEQGDALAKREDARFVFWAADALMRLRTQ